MDRANDSEGVEDIAAVSRRNFCTTFWSLCGRAINEFILNAHLATTVASRGCGRSFPIHRSILSDRKRNLLPENLRGMKCEIQLIQVKAIGALLIVFH